LNGTAWISYKFIQWASCSARIEEINTDNMKGFDPLLDPLAVYDPTADPVNFGGEKTNLYFGLNLYKEKCSLQDFRVLMEYGIPL